MTTNETGRPMILVTGATGTVGREVARLLAADRPVRILTRRPERVSVSGPGVEVVPGGYADRDALDRALKGVDAAFLVTNDVSAADDAVFAEAARASGVRHLVKLSAAAVCDPGADDLVTRWQRRNEAVVRGSGLDWTILRPRSFMSNTLSWAPSIRSEGVVRALYASSANACVDPRDVARVAVLALTEPGHRGREYLLSGPQALTAVEQTAQLADALRRPLRLEELTPAAARAQLLTRCTEPVADALMASAERQLAGAKAQVDRTISDLIDRQPLSFRTWAADHAAAFG
jgi:uncharacterized protein YbjT (DUF2867 family)